MSFTDLQCTHNEGGYIDEEGPSPVRTPSEELSTFKLSDGLKIELVAAEPMVQDPVAMVFDPDGRLWVVEMRGFMPDIDGKGEDEPIGRVSVLQDNNGDGQMDVSTVYLDSLVMPRAIALVKGGALIAEKKNLWLAEDLDGDLHAERKILIDSGYADGPSPEHSPNGLLRNTDNWLYNARSRFRYQLIEGNWKRDSTEFRGQWGISHDDQGRLYYNYNWSQLHADLVPPNYLSRNRNHTPTTGIDHGLTIDRRIYPIRPNPAVNRGYIPGTLDNDGRLLEFTAACAPFFYRGASLPREYYGNVFVCEPSGNLIKRNMVKENGLLLTGQDPTPGKEFLASTDERFRPVNLATGPDGALYISDMYRGLVQHGSYVTPYLREQTIKRKLVQPVHHGRIWRVVPVNRQPSRQQKLSNASNHELIQNLSHVDGWHRDIAQRLLVERGDKIAISALKQLALQGDNMLGRYHALWTMEGLSALTPDILVTLLADPNPLIASTALRLLEPFVRNDKNLETKVGGILRREWINAPIQQILQMTFATSILDNETSYEIISAVLRRYNSSALIRDAVLSSLQDEEFEFLKRLWKSPTWQEQEPAKSIFLEMLTTAIMKKRDPSELELLFSMLDVNELLGWKENTVLTAMSIHGKNLSKKPVRLSTTPRLLIRADGKLERSRADVLKAMFEWPGHIVNIRNLQTKNPLNESDQKQFVQGRQLYLTSCAGCHGTDGAGINRLGPPLVGSEWVTGNEKRLVLLVLHGLEGPVEVKGKRYDAPEILPVMPSHSTLDDGSISSILTYIRNEWGNTAGPVSRRVVSTTRHTSQGRVIPWTASELNKHVRETKSTDEK